jgi:hypothetical protein
LAQDKVVNEPNAEVREVGKFNGIVASGAIEVFISQGARKVVVSGAKKEDVDEIITEVKGGKLHIRYKEKKSWWSDQWNTTGRQIRVFVSEENINYISQSGSGNVKIEGTLKSESLELGVSGSGNVSGDIQASELEIRQSGSSNIKLTGTVERASFSCSGSGNISSPGLAIQDCDVRISGSGNADITVNKTLKASISGSGNVKYRGAGNLISSSTSGSGRIRKI